MNETEVNKQVMNSLFLNRNKIIIVAITFGLLAGLITFFLPKKYTAIGIVYPTNSNNMKEVVDKTYFGYEFQADRLIQLFDSQKMQEMVVARHNLLQYYELDTTSKGWRHDLKEKYSRDIEFKRTKFISVEIKVTTKSPELSSEIATTLMTFIDTIRKDILYENVYSFQENIEQRVAQNQVIVDSILFELANVSIKAKPNRLALNIISKIEENKRNGVFGLGDEIVENAARNYYTYEISKKINEYYVQSEILSNLKKELVLLKEKTSVPFPKIYKVTYPQPDYKKTSPSYAVNCLLGFLIGLLVMVGYIIFNIRLQGISKSLESD